MQVLLTIIRYPGKFVPFAFLAMALFRLPLGMRKNIRFFKLMGCGKNGTFDKTPDLRQWAILTVMNPGKESKSMYGSFIDKWLQWFASEVYTVYLDPIEGHGSWDGEPVFGNLPPKSLFEGPIATLTRATIRLSKLKFFWQHVAPVAARMKDAPGLIMSVGIGEVPWIKQATFTVWESKESIKKFAYQMKEHTEVIRKTREQNWYSEDMFVRFRITGTSGTLSGVNPLEAIL